MALKHVLSLSDLGSSGAWLILQQARGIPDARARSAFMEDMTAILLFAQDSFPERLCITAAVNLMGGHVVHLGAGAWRDEVAHFPRQLNELVSYYVDCVFLYGLSVSDLRPTLYQASVPLINAGSPDSNPANALADLACIYKHTEDFSAVRVAWIGGANGTLNSLIEATQYFPFELRMVLPRDSAPDAALLAAAKAEGRRVGIAASREEALAGAQYIFVGCAGGSDAETARQWTVTREMANLAAPGVRILLSASPTCSIPIELELLQSKASLLSRQAENRLRVHKRLLHWVFSDEV